MGSPARDTHIFFEDSSVCGTMKMEIPCSLKSNIFTYELVYYQLKLQLERLGANLIETHALKPKNNSILK